MDINNYTHQTNGNFENNYQQNLPSTPPNNYLVWAIVCTLFCCLPLGIVSIIKATEVNGLWANGQHEAAYKKAQDAKRWAIYGAITGAVVGFLYLIIFGFTAIIGS